MANIDVPETTRERIQKFQEKKEEVIEIEEGVKIKKETEPILPHPDDPIWHKYDIFLEIFKNLKIVKFKIFISFIFSTNLNS